MLAWKLFGGRTQLKNTSIQPTRRWFQSLNNSIKQDLKPNTKNTQKFTKEELLEYMHAKRRENSSHRTRSTINYALSLGIGFITLAYAAVPLYRALCSRTGYGGTPITDQRKFTNDKLIPVDTDKRIRIAFTAETSAILPWKFTPQQREVYLVPGETALAFYKARNNSNKDIVGMATYSVTPGEAAPYFNKIQCFCFEEQKLLAGEEVDMPVFFFIDPDFAKDPAMRNIDDIVLHYTFFKAHYDRNNESLAVENVVDPNAKALSL
ncbi:Cox11 protein [Saccharomycopsis crataegensis]|uniref:Cox11 protein n=1 Tax=Saccharomycopsis crataegensis TaxID=43959 RepID=A0AAV5QE99_9ASCO|nr:Cox11 protein [Saccharomycopsis crataegensis]